MLTCSESDGSPPSEYYWLKDGTQMPTEPKSSRAFSNSSYTLNHKTGELVGRGGDGAGHRSWHEAQGTVQAGSRPVLCPPDLRPRVSL